MSSILSKLSLVEVREHIQNRTLPLILPVLDTWQPADLAGLISGLTQQEQIELLAALDRRRAAATFEYLEMPLQQQLMCELPTPAAAEIANGMAPDDRTALLEQLPPERLEHILALLTPENRAVAESLLTYGPNSVGRLMTPDYVAVEKHWTVERVLEYVRNHGKDSETLNVLYVVDQQQMLIDDIRIREFLLAPLLLKVSDVMDYQFVALKASDDKRQAVNVFKKYDRSALPVVDARGRLAGIVTIDDVMDVAEQQATREIQQLGGLEALEEPYMQTTLMNMVRKRATWLVVLFVGETLTATAMGYFEDEIAKAVVLALFVPLIISSGGNSGSQAATLIVRALALGEVRLRDWWLVMRRELASGFMLGLILGAIGFLRIAVWSAFSDMYGEHWLLVALTVGMSLVGIVLWGSLSGSMLPFVLKRAGLDPATSSAPFVATLVDVTGLIIYFSVAYVVLRGTLL